MVNLIPRFYDVSEGHIYIDGVDLRDYDLQALRSKLGIIPQKAVLFSGTIEDNIRFGKEHASEEEIVEAAKIAQGYDFIMDKSSNLRKKLLKELPMYPEDKSSVYPLHVRWYVRQKFIFSMIPSRRLTLRPMRICVRHLSV